MQTLRQLISGLQEPTLATWATWLLSGECGTTVVLSAGGGALNASCVRNHSQTGRASERASNAFLIGRRHDSRMIKERTVSNPGANSNDAPTESTTKGIKGNVEACRQADLEDGVDVALQVQPLRVRQQRLLVELQLRRLHQQKATSTTPRLRSRINGVASRLRPHETRGLRKRNTCSRTTPQSQTRRDTWKQRGRRQARACLFAADADGLLEQRRRPQRLDRELHEHRAGHACADTATASAEVTSKRPQLNKRVASTGRCDSPSWATRKASRMVGMISRTCAQATVTANSC